jgi:uncharacterized protein YgiM (DUF1202 family)
MVRRRLHPIFAFAAVIAAAGSVTAAGLTFTAHTVSRTVAELPRVKTTTLPSYVVRLPEAKAADLDVSKVVSVNPKGMLPATVLPQTQPAPAAPETQVAAAATTDPTAPTLVAVTTPLDDAADGKLYIVRSDVFVRSGPSKSYGKLGTATGGTEVQVIGEHGGWLKVSFSGGTGWVYQRYLAPADRVVAEADTTAAPF